jgi:hypothetical protein
VGDRLRGLPLRTAQSELLLLLVFDVGRGTNPQVDLTVGIAMRNGAEGMPSEDPVEAANPVLQQVVRAGHRRVFPCSSGPLGVLGMDERDPVPVVIGFSRAARVVRALPVEVRGRAVG